MKTVELDNNGALLMRLIMRTARMGLLKKAVFSKSRTEGVQKAVVSVKTISGKECLQIESFHTDNKAMHKNIALDAEGDITELILGFDQINLISTAGDCEFKRSKSSNTALIGGTRLESALGAEDGLGIKTFARITPTTNNKRKQYILSGDEPFLKLLQVSDKNGRVYDKKQAKFRQINRFLELIRDVESHLPDGDIRICDLCCGKSYLSFAVYHYFAIIKGRHVRMTGVDLKSDVIEYCNSVARELNFDGLEFLCGDVNLYDTPDHVNMVISLHACDTATDIVLNKAIEWGADVVLSTPCCHHDLNRRLNCAELDFIAGYSMLRQKLCDAATDALRLKLLEVNGYETAALELIDPEETPKNVMLRGIRKKNFDRNSDRARESKEEYCRIYKFLTGTNPDKE